MLCRIVVADKDPISLPTVSKIFEGADWQFTGVVSATELKQTIKKSAPDLIILNSLLADTPNWQAVQKIVSGIRASRDFSRIPILLMSGDLGSPRSDELSIAGVDGCIDKPIDGSELRNAVHSLLGVSNGSHIEQDDEDITLEFENGWSGIDEPPAARETGYEPAPDPDAHIVDLPHTDTSLPIDGAQIQDMDVPADTEGGMYELGKEESNLKPYQDSGSWLDTFNEPLSNEPTKGTAQVAPETILPDLEFVSKVYEAPLSESADQSTVAPGDEFVLHDIETDRSPEMDSGLPSAPAQFTSPHPELSSGSDEKQRIDILSQTRNIITEALPSRDEISAIVEQHIASVIPSKDELAATFEAAIERTVYREFRTLDFRGRRESSRLTSLNGVSDQEDFAADGSLHLEAMAGTELPQDPFVSELPSPTRFENIFLEKYLKNAVPERDEIAALINASIGQMVVDAVEKVVREQIEKITSDVTP